MPLKYQGGRGALRRAPESSGELRRAPESSGEFWRAPESPGEPRRALRDPLTGPERAPESQCSISIRAPEVSILRTL
eukprot:15472931-Alexandrium_andersonii.AAC.1